MEWEHRGILLRSARIRRGDVPPRYKKRSCGRSGLALLLERDGREHAKQQTCFSKT